MWNITLWSPAHIVCHKVCIENTTKAAMLNESNINSHMQQREYFGQLFNLAKLK